jgi:hypothetical protein
MCTAVAKICSSKHIIGTKQHDPKRLAPNFAFVLEEQILKTINHTTQYARMDTRLPLHKHFKSRFPEVISVVLMKLWLRIPYLL